MSSIQLMARTLAQRTRPDQQIQSLLFARLTPRSFGLAMQVAIFGIPRMVVAPGSNETSLVAVLAQYLAFRSQRFLSVLLHINLPLGKQRYSKPLVLALMGHFMMFHVPVRYLLQATCFSRL